MWLPRCVLLVLLAISAAEQQFQQQRQLPQPWGGRSHQTKDEDPIIFEDSLRAKEQARSSSPTSQVGYSTNQQTNNQGQGETGYQVADVLTKKFEDNPPSYEYTRTQNNGQGYQSTSLQADTYSQQNPLTAKRPTLSPANTQNGQAYQPTNSQNGQEYQSTNTQNGQTYQPTNTQNGQAYQEPNPQADYYNQQNPLTAKRPMPQAINTQNGQGYQQPSTQADPYNQQNPLTAKRPTPHPINTQEHQPYQPTNTQNGQGYQQPSTQADPYNQQNPLTAKRPTPHPINTQEYQPYQPTNTQNGQGYQQPSTQADPYNQQNPLTAKRPTPHPINTQEYQPYQPTNTQNGQVYQQPKPQAYNPPNPLTAKRPMPQQINTQNSQGYQPSTTLGQNQGQGYQPTQNSPFPQTNNQRQPSFNQQTNYTKQFSTEDQYEEERGLVKKYDRCQVWNVIIDDDKSKLNVVGGLTRVQELTSWGGNHTAVDFLVKPENQIHVGAILRRSNIKYSVVISDLQKNIDNENPPLSEEDQELQDRKGHRMTWQQYHRLADIYGYLDYLAITYPSICSVRSIGRSHEGREIKMLRISNGKPTNKAVLIDGGIHAREWISPATVTYMINEFVENFEVESDTVRNMDWYIVPVLNPDGYEYTHTFDRLWRKNRRRFGTCSGVDLNRNFGYRWGGQGTSKNPCSEVYPGSQAFSEPESKALSDFVRLSTAKFKLYATYHSYGEYILYPWGYDKVVPEDYKELDLVANDAAQAIINKGGPKYKVGASSLVLYPASGGSDDWAKAVGKIKYTYTVELSDSGRFGFVLPAAYITKVAKESLAALRVMADAANRA